MIHHVEELTPKLQFALFCENKILEEGKVDIDLAGAFKDIASETTIRSQDSFLQGSRVVPLRWTLVRRNQGNTRHRIRAVLSGRVGCIRGRSNGKRESR